ncbi:MAG: pyridoxamine 5'-phosphate oxidase family protein [Spirochaetales bacterium]|nr:pyridoxamine 5'-phosphate oxidase family protein [Spirochaetales bacterium]
MESDEKVGFDELMERVAGLMDLARVALLSTVDAEGRPRARWMTPVTLPGLPGRIFAVSSPKFDKVLEIAANPAVSWSIQTAGLDVVAEARGQAWAVDDQKLKAGVLEAIGPHLEAFWNANPNPRDLVVLETGVDEIVLSYPLEGRTLRAARKEESRGR